MVEKLRRGRLRIDELQDHEENDKKAPFYKRITWVAVLLLVVVAVIVTVVVVNKGEKRLYTSYEVINTIDFTAAGVNHFIPYKNGFIKFNNDGIEAMNHDGTLLWNIAYNMKDPITDLCGNSLAVADRGAKAIYISDGSSTVSTFEVINPIVDIQVGNQGVVAVLTNDGMEDHIYLYSINGKMLLDMKTNVAQDGFPLDMAISNDAKKLITSYISLAEDKMVNWLTFYNFSEVGENYEDKVVASVSFDSTIIPEVIFLNNENACIYKKDGFSLYKIKERPELIKEETINGEIVNVFSSEKYLGFIVRESDAGKLLIYDMFGNIVLTQAIEEDYARAMISGEEIILHGSSAGVIYRINGSMKFKSDFEEEIELMLPIVDDTDKYMLVRNTKAETISLTEGAEQ